MFKINNGVKITMKKSWLIIIIIAVVFIVGINKLNDEKNINTGNDNNGWGNGGFFSSGLEKELIATLPDEITTCYYEDANGFKNLNVLEIKNFTIERQTTDGNFKSADCTIEMEGSDLKKTIYVNLTCIKYDDGSWQVEGYSELSNPKLVPKCQPSEAEFISYIKQCEGFQLFSKKSENIDLENGQIVYSYSVIDKYDYMTFTGEGISCSATFVDAGKYNDKDVYYWYFESKNNLQLVWDVLGTWHMDASSLITKEPPYHSVDMVVTALDENNAGTMTYTYPCHDGYRYTGEYRTVDDGSIGCYFKGNNPLNAVCEIYGISSSITITANGVSGNINGKDAVSITKK